MGLLHRFGPSARPSLGPPLLVLVALSLTIGLATGPSAGAKSFKKDLSDGAGFGSMAWSGESVGVLAAPTAAPGQRMPSIDGDLVACRIGSATRAAGFDIRFRFLGGARGTWGGSGDQTQPAVSQGLIAGLDNGRVAVYDPATGLAVPVSDDAAIPAAPAFSGDLVVWQDRRNGDWDVFARRFDRGTGQPSGDVFAICAGPGDQQYPAVDGDTVVWQDRRSGDWDVFAYDVTQATESAIAAAPGEQCRPDVCGAVVVWQDSRRGNWDIFARDLSGAETWAVSTARGPQVYPAVSDQLIVWQDSQPRFVQRDDGPTVRYTDPDVGSYSLLAREELGSLGAAREGPWQKRPDVSGDLTVFEDQWKASTPDISRLTCWRTFDLWAYTYSVTPEYFWWTNASELTFSIDVVVCPNPPVAEMSVTVVEPSDWPPVEAWEPFAPVKIIALTMADGRKDWWFSLKDSAGNTPGSDGSGFYLDTAGPSCVAPSAVTVKSGATVDLPFNVTDALSPEAKVTITIKRGDGSVVATLPSRWVRTNRLLARGYFADLLRGTYTFEVTAIDLAGNDQVQIGANTLTVR